jgi:hypothetical protein
MVSEPTDLHLYAHIATANRESFKGLPGILNGRCHLLPFKLLDSERPKLCDPGLALRTDNVEGELVRPALQPLAEAAINEPGGKAMSDSPAGCLDLQYLKMAKDLGSLTTAATKHFAKLSDGDPVS